jgi:hypothetical protein
MNAGLPIYTYIYSLYGDTTSVMLAGTSYTGIIRSPDQGNTWEEIFYGLEQVRVQSFAGLRAGTILAGTNQGLFCSRDSGQHWSRWDRGIPESSPVPALAVNSLGYVFAATNQGVFVSQNQGLDWNLLGQGFPEATVTALALDSAGYLYAGTAGKGIYRSRESTGESDRLGKRRTGSNPDNLVFSLGQNSPNPFNPVSLIVYKLPKDENDVEMLVFNTAGRLVEKLVHGPQKAGAHRVRWEAIGKSSGIYIYKLRAGNLIAIRKGIILK